MEIFDTLTYSIDDYVHIPDRYVPPRAIAALPGVLQCRHGSISPRRPLPSRVRFGPVKGIRTNVCYLEARNMVDKSVESNTPLFLLEAAQNYITHIGTTDQDKSNWLSLLPLGDKDTANVWIYEDDNELYALTTKLIPLRVPLKLGYSRKYIQTHGFPLESPSLDLHEALASPPSEWWCYECQRAMPSAALLQHHVEIEHKNESVLPRRRYRCQRCKRTFARLFTLKRHMKRHCSNKDEKRIDVAKQTDNLIPNDELELESNSILEESRVPSEEILQNLSTSLDFNTLFDTYRMSNLDLSGSSKSVDLIESENHLSKDDSGLTNVEDPFTRDITSADVCLYKNTSDLCEEPLPILKNCSSTSNRKSKTYSKKKKPTPDPVIEQIGTEISDIIYKCEDCQLMFKRRGMFVNHLWRVHQNVSASVPLERRERHYPCPACCKVYRTAAKRDAHLKNHHPGIGGSARAVDSGRRACAAAACAACPRQYATRAKLLQHVRHAHPLIAPPLKKCSSKAEK